MNTKKQPPQDCNLGRGQNRLNEQEESTKFVNNLQASITSRGVVVNRYKRGNLSDNSKNLKKREAGDIASWSRASQRKMKRFLMDYREKEGWFNYALTLTVPGPVLSPGQSKELFRKYMMRLSGSRIKFLMVWRAEVQKRGSVHWHCIVSLENPSERGYFVSIWWDVVSELGKVENHVYSTGTTVSASSRMALAGAIEHAVKLENESGNDCWWRYISDHATKAKQEQIGENIGRHWGVIGRKYAVPSVSEVICRLSDEQAIKLDRFLRRLRTPRVKKDNDPFGFGLGWTPKMSRYGRADYFGHQKAVERFLGWIGALSEPAPQSPQGDPQSKGGEL